MFTAHRGESVVSEGLDPGRAELRLHALALRSRPFGERIAIQCSQGVVLLSDLGKREPESALRLNACGESF